MKNVTELEKEIEEINRIYGKNITLEDIPLDDKLTWKAFQQCNTLGVFQFASNVALPVLKKMQCSNIEELAAANSLIRPGTGGLDDYCKGKKDPGSIKKIDKRLSKCLEPTYGAIIFQEQIMFLISELMGISFGQADIYRRALEKMHKPANKAKVDYFNENAVKLAVERGIPEEDAEYIKKMILDNCGYAFNKCLSGRTKIKRVTNQHNNYTIEEMYKIKNDREYAKSIDKLALHKKYKSTGYGKAYSMQDDGRLRLNDIKDIVYSGEKAVFKVTTADGSFIECTMNHSFPTPNGVKLLADLNIGDELYVNAGYEKQKYKKLNKIRSNNYPSKGQQGFIKGGTNKNKCTVGTWKFNEYRNKCKNEGRKCEICNGIASELHHIDENHDNNVIENFKWLCVSCHKKEQYAIGRRKKDEKGLLTKTSKIISIDYVCNEKVYDVEMADPYHNFATESGIIVKNSHAVCYSYISYYTAYMKIHYPLIFHKTMLNGNLGNLSEFIDMARTEKVTLNPPHINYSVFTTEIENEQDKVLRIGFNALKGVGEKAVEDIKAARPFKSVNDYLERIGKAGKNKKVVQTLIKFGTFDGLRVEVNYNCLNTSKLEEQGINFNENGILLNRKQLMKWYECYLEYKSQTKMPCYDVPATMIKNKYIEKYQLKQESSGTYTIPITMLSMMEIKEDSVKKSRRIPKGLLKEIVQNTTTWADPMTRPFTNNLQDISKLLIDNKQIYLEEMEENEFSFVEHPLNQFVTGMTNFKEAKDGELCIEAGIMTFLEKRKSKNNKDYYWLTIRTPRESVRITLWNNQFEKYKSFIKKNALVKVKGIKGYGGMGCEIMQPLKNQY